MPKIVYTKEEKGSFILPPGDYVFSLTNYKWEISKGSKTAGADMVSLEFQTKKNIWLFDRLIFAPSTVWKASAFLRAFGVEAAEDQEVEINNTLFDSLIGHECTIKIKNEEYNGQMQNKLEAYIPKKSEPEVPLEAPAGNIPF